MDTQIYSATYSNVPVFEFVTSEGPVMRRKADSYINATHILKIAKFPKAKRTRILEKDVQTRTHDKVQGGYGKYQGTYVPLDIGEEIARNFGIYEVLRPIFEFTYVEGRSQTPPPAPKHSHASASNVARKAALGQQAGKAGRGPSAAKLAAAAAAGGDDSSLARKTKSMSSITGEPPRKRGRPRREPLAIPNAGGPANPMHQPIQQPFPPSLNRNDTAPIRVGPPPHHLQHTQRGPGGPSIGTFNNSRNNSLLKSSQQLQSVQGLSRQDTDQDALQLMVNSLNVQNDDLEVAEKSSDDEAGPHHRHHPHHPHHHLQHPQDNSLDDDDDNDELMTGHELFGSPRNSFEKIVQSHNSSQHTNGVPPPPPGSFNTYPAYGAALHSQYHHPLGVSVGGVGGVGAGGSGSHTNSSTTSAPTPIPTPLGASSSSGGGGVAAGAGATAPEKEANAYADYFTSLLNYFLEDSNNSKNKSKAGAPPGALVAAGEVVPTSIPFHILHPPQPLAKININQPVDNDGNTILHWACSMANTNIIEFLLEIFHEYLDANVKNAHGETPLMFLVRFSNSFQLKNFPTLLDLLSDSILAIDGSGKTILHHVVLSATSHKEPSSANGGGGGGSISSFSGDPESQQYVTYKKNKEKFARYYMETLFAKIIEFQESRPGNGGSSSAADSKAELIAKVINHQDTNQNTAFHIVAYNLNKKLIKVFIGYHKYIDFALKNAVGFTVEEYLASHNYVLRLGNEQQQQQQQQQGLHRADATGRLFSQTPSFENQLFVSKTAVNTFKAGANGFSEKLVELAYAIDKELAEKDEKLLAYYKLLKFARLEKLQSQREVLKFFKLDHLLENSEQELQVAEEQDDADASKAKESRDSVIQDEISRLVNDLTYEYLKRKDELERQLQLYRTLSNRAQGAELQKLEKKYLKLAEDASPSKAASDQQERIRAGIRLQAEIVRRRALLKQLVVEHSNVPVTVNDKENRVGDEENRTGGAARAADNGAALAADAGTSIVAKYASDDKINKYCKLISSCCGMNFNDVEKSIDLIEQSLARAVPQGIANTTSSLN